MKNFIILNNHRLKNFLILDNYGLRNIKITTDEDLEYKSSKSKKYN